jgi:hypothetical protein
VPLAESVALIDSETLPPSVVVWVPGLVIVMGLLTFQVKLWLAV